MVVKAGGVFVGEIGWHQSLDPHPHLPCHRIVFSIAVVFDILSPHEVSNLIILVFFFEIEPRFAVLVFQVDRVVRKTESKTVYLVTLALFFTLFSCSITILSFLTCSLKYSSSISPILFCSLLIPCSLLFSI